VFGGECKTYLLDKAKGIIQRENPYRHAIETAKVIELSGSLLNLSGYNTLCRGMEADEHGKIDRMSGWLCSTYQLKKAMKNVEEHAKGVIPFEVAASSLTMNHCCCTQTIQARRCCKRHQSAARPNFYHFGWG
jgi:hypothetical protein